MHPAFAPTLLVRLFLAQSGAEWTTYHGAYSSWHHSSLTQIQPGNLKDLELKWVWQARSLEAFQAAPIVTGGVMYFTEPSNNVVALDPITGREYWSYEHPLPEVTYNCCGKVNRGVAVAHGMVYVATLDMKVIALDAVTGRKKWETAMGDYRQGYALTHAPLVIKDKVLVGTAGGELGTRGYLCAFDAFTGKEVWRFKTIPEPGEPGNETWGGDSWKHGGAPVWLTGSYDPELNLTYWGLGNPGPDWNPDLRPGDNLYSSSVVALNPDTGKLQWYFQFTPHDEWDWDSVQTPVLVDREYQGKPRKLMLWANRNGFYYVLDRTNGQFLHGVPFVKQTWAEGLDGKGRPIKIPGRGPSTGGTLTYPGVQGGTNWFSPSYSPRTNYFYVNAWDDYFGVYYKWQQQYEQGKWYTGGFVKSEMSGIRRTRTFRRDPAAGRGAIRALNALTGERIWEFPTVEVSDGGLLTTASDLLITGNREGHFYILDARSGKLLWRKYLGGQTAASPITYSMNGRQFIAIAVGHSMFAFGLRD
jgi:alcohol dehydrogenase (cytochrome c)